MIATVHTGGASFKGVVDYCLSEGRAREDERDERDQELDKAGRGEDKAGRVAWSETRNVAAEDPRQAARGDGGHRVSVGGAEAVGGGEGRGPGSGEAGVSLLAELGQG